MKRRPVIALCILGFLLAGCAQSKSSPAVAAGPLSTSGSAVSDQDAITAAIDKHLRANSGINMSVMDMTVSNVQVTGDQAHANAEFHLKQGGTSMFITYKLDRHAGGWIVVSNQPSGGQFTHPPMDKTHEGGAASPSAQTPPDFSEFLKNHASNARTSPQ